ncbi:hypothetical protein CspeluHIS016_0108430 [Cutaneotrichosporon spelunceum]|uniref:Uncharacterized protein n=1 Tax=Cutaneotrichosporon spelunceum TaxID=1672016 RepID=A0AAD3TPA2_9TREE|nr:hypothetical protein CspeluHIS016_0108430 [Cutaneotrichosporon spelunceum]
MIGTERRWIDDVADQLGINVGTLSLGLLSLVLVLTFVISILARPSPADFQRGFLAKEEGKKQAKGENKAGEKKEKAGTGDQVGRAG